MDLLGRLKNSSSTKKGKDIPEIEYLKNGEFSIVVNRGLSELYKVQPKNPVTFLSNWLINEARSKEILNKFEEEKHLKGHLEEKYRIAQEKKKIIEEKKMKEQQIEQDKKEAFRNYIIQCNDFQEHLNEICERLKKLVNATGVYVSIYDFKRKPVREDDDETAHLDKIKVIRYIHWCDDHDFLHGKYIEPNAGVTYSLIMPKEDIADPNAGAGVQPVEGDGNQEVKAENPDDIKFKKVAEVISEPSIKFFREPRLGCYIACDLTYKTSMTSLSLLSAIEYLKEYNENKSQQDERRRQYDERVRQRDAMNINNSNQTAEGNEQINSSAEPIEEWTEEPVKLQEYMKEDKVLILSLDTLGQDREFKKEEMDIILDTAKLIKTSIIQLEQRLLEKDRDLKIEFDRDDKVYRDQWPGERIEADEEKYIKDYFSSETFIQKGITDEGLKAREGDMVRARYILNSILEDATQMKLLAMFNQFEFVEKEKIFQNIFYFVKIPSQEINEPETNKLDWKRARSHWTNEIFEHIADYNPIGPKPGKSPSVFKGNKILANLEGIAAKKEELRDYSFGLSRLLDFLILILKIRRDDIIKRREDIDELKSKRQAVIEENEKIDAERDIALQEAKKASVDENGEPIELNEEEWIKKFEDEHPKKEVPQDVEYDLDEDFEI